MAHRRDASLSRQLEPQELNMNFDLDLDKRGRKSKRKGRK
jgi:hypothetical protein